MSETSTSTRSVDLVSVIVPCYRQTQYLAQAVESVLAQTYPHYEVIVVDDGSPDGEDIAGVLQPYLHNTNSAIHLLRLPHNGGTAAARNAGVRAAQGEYLQFLDADDWLAPEKFARQITLLQQQPAAGLVYCEVDYLLRDGSTVQQQNSLSEVYPLERDAFNALWLNSRFVVHAALLRRTWFERAGGFDPSLQGVEDYELWLRMAALGCHMHSQPDVLATYRRHDSNKTNDVELYNQRTELVRRKIITQFPDQVARATVELFGPYSRFLTQTDEWARGVVAALEKAEAYARKLETEYAMLQQSHAEATTTTTMLKSRLAEADAQLAQTSSHQQAQSAALEQAAGYARKLEGELAALEESQNAADAHIATLDAALQKKVEEIALYSSLAASQPPRQDGENSASQRLSEVESYARSLEAELAALRTVYEDAVGYARRLESALAQSEAKISQLSKRSF